MILMTGGSGFLGRNIPFRCSTSDLMDYGEVHKEFRDKGPKTILHLAAVCGGIQFNIDNPADIIDSNAQMALNVFRAARARGVGRVVTIGSTCAYPATAPSPFRVESYHNGLPDPSNGPYGMAKRFIHSLGEAYSTQAGIAHLHIVIANMYGPGDKSDHVIPMLIKKFSGPGPVEIWGDGTALREFLFVKDAAKIVKRLTESDDVGIVNVGSGSVVTISKLAAMIRGITGYKGDVVYNHDKPAGQGARLLDSKYMGRTSLEDGLRETILDLPLDKHR